MVKRKQIGSKLYDVVSYEDYYNHKDIYDNTDTAVEMNVEGKDYVLPVRGSNDTKPGLYNHGCIDEMVLPSRYEGSIYSNEGVIDFNDANNIREVLEKQNQIRDIEIDMLVSPDNITVPNISNLDSPEMKGLKQAIIAKNMDIDKYASRFGSNFPNDKRLLKSNSITQKMLKRICKGLDINATLVLKDANPDVPNPMGKEITIDLTEDGEEDEDD